MICTLLLAHRILTILLLHSNLVVIALLLSSPITANSRYLWNKDPKSNEVKKWLLDPLPQAEINKNYGLVQNPGWE